jgi:hypothetical protein
MREWASAISAWEINKCKNGHERASEEWRELYLLLLSSDAKDGGDGGGLVSGGGGNGGGGGMELLSLPQGHGIVKGWTGGIDSKNRKNKQPRGCSCGRWFWRCCVNVDRNDNLKVMSLKLAKFSAFFVTGQSHPSLKNGPK